MTVTEAYGVIPPYLRQKVASSGQILSDLFRQWSISPNGYDWPDYVRVAVGVAPLTPPAAVVMDAPYTQFTPQTQNLANSFTSSMPGLTQGLVSPASNGLEPQDVIYAAQPSSKNTLMIVLALAAAYYFFIRK